MKLMLSIIALLLTLNANAQVSFQYKVALEPVVISNLSGLHSYAFAQDNGLWLLIGGRTDGIHPRQPNSSFPASSNNTNVYVVDVNNQQFWSSSLSALPVNLQEQLQATNMNFHQVGDTLYIAGGYGYSASQNDHITFPYLSTIQVSGLIQAVVNALPIGTFFKQIMDNRLAVTGGQLEELDGIFYLIGGHRFDGRYNPIGHNTYVQTYTSEIRKFRITGASVNPVISNYSALTDGVHLHRRDYNLLPQIFPDGSRGFTISSGVFQTNVDLPYLYPVDIKPGGITAQTSFNQYLSHYHSATAALYDNNTKVMHNLFFGGMSQYQYVNGNLVQDNQVPFVKTISRLSRAADGTLYEFQLSTEMPGYKGSSAEFILNDEVPHDEADIIQVDQFTSDSTLIGYIFGGIESSATNPFSLNQTNLTKADASIYKVYLIKSVYAGTEAIQGNHSFEFEVFPNPASEVVNVAFELREPMSVVYHITDLDGRLIQTIEKGRLHEGLHEDIIQLSNSKLTTIMVHIVFDGKYFTSKPVLRKP